MTEKLRICFVDDEPNILQGLKRFMRGMADQWDMEFCESGEAALQMMDDRGPFDAVVSDMRMPGMDGAHLLSTVRERYPSTIRVILSGYADSESVLRTVGPAHVYLAKPCDTETLRNAIQKPLALRKLLDDDGLRQALGSLASLPSLPTSLARLHEELASPHASTASVGAIIAQDIAMAAEILKLTNSAYFGIGGKVSSILQAVRTLGLETIQALATQIGIFRQFSGHAAVTPLLESLNTYSLALARLAEAIAQAEGATTVEARTASCAAMLSCVGWLVLLDSHPEKYKELLTEVGPKNPLAALEQRIFGATHGRIGAYLLGLWGFSDRVVEAVAFAETPMLSPNADNIALTALHAAITLGPRFILLPPVAGRHCTLDADYLLRIGCQDKTGQWKKLAQQITNEVKS